MAGFSRFDDAHAAHLERLRAMPEWEEVERELRRHALTPSQQLRLQPTASSLLR